MMTIAPAGDSDDDEEDNDEETPSGWYNSSVSNLSLMLIYFLHIVGATNTNCVLEKVIFNYDTFI